MKTGIKIVNRSVNFEGNRTRCTIKVYVKLDNLLMGIGVEDIKSILIKKKLITSSGHFTVSSCVVCSKDDNYDKDLGAKLAESKAMARVFKQTQSILNYIRSIFSIRADIHLSNAVSTAKGARSSELAHFERLVCGIDKD